MGRFRRHRNHHDRHDFHKQNKHSKDKSKPFSCYIKKFFFWFIIYVVLITLSTILLKGTKIYEAKIGFYLIIGFLLVIASRVIYSATHKRSLRLEGIMTWGIIYTVIFGLLSHVLSLLPQIKINSAYDLYFNIVTFSVIFTIIIMFLRRMKIKNTQNRRTPIFIRAPSQIILGIMLFIAGLLVFRFSYQIFVGWFNWAEGMAWSWLIGIILIVVGILTLVAWWRNNVLQHRIGIKFGHWK